MYVTSAEYYISRILIWRTCVTRVRYAALSGLHACAGWIDIDDSEAMDRWRCGEGWREMFDGDGSMEIGLERDEWMAVAVHKQ
mmetsp:Transcript_17170/g.32687  ORF Transcript_17170/g.32687 Transcript_17170/m.32687 type:complete len:83 (+) Transcript_17170:32-280(+)